MKNISSELNLYLKANLDKPSIDFQWTEDDNEKFFTFLSKHFTKEELSTSEIQLKIKQSFKDYFESAGYLLIKLSEDQIRIKVFEYKTKPEDSQNLDSIIEIITANEDLIEYDYKGKEDLISITKGLKMKIISFVSKINNEEVNKKELIKHAVREAFELENNDIVIIKKDQIFIKLLDDFEVKEIPEEEKNTIASRYNGIDEEKLKSFYDEIFSQEENKDFFYFAAEEFVDIHFLEKKIDNVNYEKNAFSIVQSIITDMLIDSFDHHEDFFKGFSGYIFRIHFKEVFGHVADIILAELSSSNEYIINFLKYYSLDVVVLNGKKYKVPRIEAENGLKWNVASMMSIVKIYVKARVSLEEIEEDIESLTEEIEDLYVNNLSLLEYNNALKKELDKEFQEISYLSQKLNLYIDTYDSSKDEKEKHNLKPEIMKIKHELLKHKDQQALYNSKIVSKEILTKYTDIKREIDALRRQEKRDNRILKQNEESYLSIKNSLVKALTSKKTLLSEVIMNKKIV